MRPSGRSPEQMRSVTFETGFTPYAEGSCLAKFGETHVLCNATVEERVPPWMRNSGRGWVTAEYGMLPRSTHDRTDREAARGKQSGRTQEIQRRYSSGWWDAHGIYFRCLGGVKDCDGRVGPVGGVVHRSGGWVDCCSFLRHLRGHAGPRSGLSRRLLGRGGCEFCPHRKRRYC